MKKINKRTLIILTFIVVILAAISYRYISHSKEKDVDYYKNVEKINLFDSLHFYTEIDDNGINHKLNIEFIGLNDAYVADLYIPGKSKDLVYLMWEEEKNENYVQQLFKKYNSGELKMNKDYLSFFIMQDNKRINFLLRIIKTSDNITPLYIDIDESLGSIEKMNNDWEHETNCYGRASFDGNEYFMSIKGRGNSTWTEGLKKPYNITFLDSEYSKKQSVSMIDGIKTKKWSLLANYADPSLLRNKIGYDLANKMSVGLESKYYDVWMNGNYLGNYLITPKSDYQATDEGFILELDNHTDNEDPQFNLKDEGKEINTLLFTVKSNESDIDVKDIEKYMQKTWDAIEDYDSDEYLQYIDIDSWARVYLLNELYKNNDVVRGSILMHRDGQSNSDKLIAGPIWDLDNGLGALTPFLKRGQSNEEMFSGGCWYISTINWEEGDYCFYQELGKHEDFLRKVQEVYKEYRDEFIDLPNQVINNRDEAYDSFIADFDKWGNNRTLYDFYTDYVWDYEGPYSIYYSITNSYDDYCNNLYNYVSARIKFLDENIDNIE